MSGDHIGPTRLFVYGSLLPGQSNWHWLEPWVTDHGEPATVPGDLFDTGHGWPAAVFGDGPATVVGRVFTLRPETCTEALRVLDEFEDVPTGKYARIEVCTDRGVTAWAYHAMGSPRLDRVPSGDWAAHLGATAGGS